MGKRVYTLDEDKENVDRYHHLHVNPTRIIARAFKWVVNILACLASGLSARINVIV